MEAKYSLGDTVVLQNPEDMKGLLAKVIHVDTTGKQVANQPYYRLKLEKPYHSGGLLSMHPLLECSRSEQEITLHGLPTVPEYRIGQRIRLLSPAPNMAGLKAKILSIDPPSNSRKYFYYHLKLLVPYNSCGNYIEHVGRSEKEIESLLDVDGKPKPDIIKTCN
jgi:hypothetical protein